MYLEVMDLKYSASHYVWVLWAGLLSLIAALSLVTVGGVALLWIVGTWCVYSFMAMMNSAGFHRLFSHRSYETTPFWEWFFLVTGTLSCYGSSFVWTAVHTEHHKHADTELDPHHFKSWWQVFTTNYTQGQVSFSARRALARLSRKPGHAFFHRFYWAFPASLALILALLGPKVLLFLYMAPVGLVIFSAAVFNHVAHGESGPNSDAVWTMTSSGEWNHELHHAEPWRWDLRQKWWHLDPAASFISLIRSKQ